MIQRIAGLTYSDLDSALRHLGFEVNDNDGRIYNHPLSGAKLSLPSRPMDEPLAAYHLVAARGIVDNFGILDRNDFDLLLMRQAVVVPPALAT